MLRDDYQFDTVPRLERTILRDKLAGAPVAVLTRGARAVLVSGPERVFAEPATTAATVATRDWVRVAPRRFDPVLLDDPEYGAWLESAIADRSVDVLAAACEYVSGSPQLVDAAGAVYARDVAYGTGGETGGGADFFSCLGISWTWSDGRATAPDPAFLGRLDCSGFVRMVYGYRSGVTPYRVNVQVDGLPRSSWAMAEQASGVLVATGPDAGRPPVGLDGLQAGDLVFFALSDAAPERVSHVGIYLGVDNLGGRRFVSSRSIADGPTFGDVGGRSILEGTYFAPKLRRVVRL